VYQSRNRADRVERVVNLAIPGSANKARDSLQ